jgi:hypothetical protein
MLLASAVRLQMESCPVRRAGPLGNQQIIVLAGHDASGGGWMSCDEKRFVSRGIRVTVQGAVGGLG